MAVSHLLGRFVTRTCTHEFLWPDRNSTGNYHQTCARCGKQVSFDWKSMARGEKGHISGHTSDDSTEVWVADDRAQRFTVRKPIFYRLAETAQFKLGVLLNISESGVLLECQSQISPGQELEMLFEMPLEITGQPNRTVLSKGVVVRIAAPGPGNSIGVKLSGYRFLSK